MNRRPSIIPRKNALGIPSNFIIEHSDEGAIAVKHYKDIKEDGNDSQRPSFIIDPSYDIMVHLDDVIRKLRSPACIHGIVQLDDFVIRAICYKAREVLMSEPSLLEIRAPLYVLGDIHGQYTNLLKFFDIAGYPPNANFLLLGDYVDRGKQSIETLTLLLAYKVRYPKYVHLLRGNHESESLNYVYGFFDECKRRYTVKLWRSFVDCYNCLPLAAIIENTIFCCHGGLSPNLFSMDQIRLTQRPVDIPQDGLVCDILWSDPCPKHGWAANDRGVSYTFGPDVVGAFLARHKLTLVCRGHQVVEDGYEFFAKRQLVTLFSAPNYCGMFDNAGAMMCVDSNLLCSFHIQRPLTKPRPSLGAPNKETPTQPQNTY